MNQAEIDYARIKQAIQFMVQHLAHQPSMAEVAEHVHLSQFHFQRLFKQWAGVSPKKFLQFITLNALKQRLAQAPDLHSLGEALGLSSSSRVYDLFVKIEAVTPEEYKHQGRGTVIRYGFAQTPFGTALLGITDRGICALEFADDNSAEVLQRFYQRWQQATLAVDDKLAATWAAKIFSAELSSIKALLIGTPFQLKVWEALLKIPLGNLVHYATIAQEIGKPKASRAVGTAIGQNPLAYVIPCHRVIRSLGGLGGYKWELDRKLSMIGWEAAQSTPENMA